MSLWALSNPDDLVSLQRSSAVNGMIRNPYQIPTLEECPECGNSGGLGGIIPIECPQELRELLETHIDHGEYINLSHEEYGKVVDVARKYFREKDIIAGSRLLPLYWHVPSPPEQSVFWPGLRCIFHESLVAALEQNQVTGLKYIPIEVARVGSLRVDNKSWNRKLDSLDDSEMLEASRPFVDNVERYGNFFLVEAEEKVFYRMANELNWIFCSTCGHVKEEPNHDQYQEMVETWSQDFVIPRRFVPDLDVFKCPGLGRFVINDKVKEILKDSESGNFMTKAVRII
ncbi:hypothetical protein KOR42_53850 [Thalassoglobus neptunius]|uniref:Uncharacterized protein n=1 Tax=Thalassoglobus neptunius TaxID=1938619 RepID=A0A5C5V2F9_9PLAN|nr:hypothetical protein [Thalassoglobus neptunius]TWT32571.1 hypothetical protein KOR42_53850 [Thalassoglobus neptunius]